MDIKIEYGKHNCVNFVRVHTADELYKDSLHKISRELTGTTGEDGNGIFVGIDSIELIPTTETVEIWFERNSERKVFSFQKFTRGSVMPQLKERIKAVKAWFDKFDYETIESGVL